MRKLTKTFIILSIVSLCFLSEGCTPKAGSHRVRMVKPKKRWRPYNAKKDKKKKRTKIVIFRSKRSGNL